MVESEILIIASAVFATEFFAPTPSHSPGRGGRIRIKQILPWRRCGRLTGMLGPSASSLRGGARARSRR